MFPNSFLLAVYGNLKNPALVLNDFGHLTCTSTVCDRPTGYPGDEQEFLLTSRLPKLVFPCNTPRLPRDRTERKGLISKLYCQMK